MNEMCHCGKKLHYADKKIEHMMMKFIKESGEFVIVFQVTTGKSYKVPRHFIALHGINERQLGEYGFEQVKAE